LPNPPTKEFPLRHKFAYDFTLKEYQTTPDDYATILPLWFADQSKTEALAQDVQVNRSNDNYEGIVKTPAVYMNSRVNMIKITEYVTVPPELDVPDMLYHKSLITIGMGDADVQDPQGNTLLSKLKFSKAADTIHPTWSGNKLEHGGYAHADVDGLTSTQQLETVVLAPETLINEKDGSLGPKIRKMVAGPFLNRVHKDFPYYDDRWYNTPSARS
jgi:hypothetical protein